VDRDELITAVVVADRIRQELNGDYVGLWKLPWHLRRELPTATDDEIRDMGEAILAGLVKVGVVIGEIDGTSGTFMPWTLAGALDAAMNAWRLLGRDPNIGEVAWLALPM